MQNSVSVVNSGESPNSCILEDIQYWERITHIYQVNEKGMPLHGTESPNAEYECYYCTNCDESFEDFDEVKEHINES